MTLGGVPLDSHDMIRQWNFHIGGDITMYLVHRYIWRFKKSQFWVWGEYPVGLVFSHFLGIFYNSPSLTPSKTNTVPAKNGAWDITVTPPMPPPQIRPLLRDYFSAPLSNTALLGPYFLGGWNMFSGKLPIFSPCEWLFCIYLTMFFPQIFVTSRGLLPQNEFKFQVDYSSTKPSRPVRGWGPLTSTYPEIKVW